MKARMTGPAASALAALSLAMLLSSLGVSIANVGLPTLAQAFDASFQEVQWVVLGYLLVVTTSVVTAGRLGDMIGRRRLLLAGLLLFTVASVLCGLAPRLWMLVAARVLQGVGAAVMMALSTALVAGTVPKEKTGSAMGLLGTTSAVGTALGPSLGGMLIDSLGWPSIFFINLPLGLVAVFLVLRSLPADRQAAGAQRVRFDNQGTLMLAVTLAAYALAMTYGQGRFGAHNAVLLLVASAGLGLFVRTERKAEAPLVPLAIFRSPVLTAGFVMSALVTAVVMATLVVGPFYLAGAFGLDAGRVGLVMSTGPIAAALAGIPAGRLVDRFGARRMGIAGLLGMAIGCLVLPMLAVRFGVPGYIAPLVATTAAYALFQAANNTAVLEGARAEQRGVISGLLSLSRNLGLITGASLMGVVFAHGAGTADLSAAGAQALAAGLRDAFGLAALLVAVALIVAAGSRALALRLASRLPEWKD